MQLSIPFKMSHLLAFCVLCLSAVFASVDNRAAVSSPSPSEDIKNNNSFYYGPSKKVEYVLRYTKKQLDKLQRKVEVLTAHKRTEGLPFISRRESACPETWARHGNSCFVVVDKKVPKWSEARKICQNLTGDLAIIRSGDENSFLSDLLKKQRGITKWGAWLGFHREADNKFYWLDGTPLEGGYTAWDSGEPNNYLGRGEDCGNLLGTGKWNDLYGDLTTLKFWINNPENIRFVLCQKKSN